MIEKCTAIVLSIAPFRETSSILYLFSQSHGLVHGIAKGILKPSKHTVRPERGHLIDLVVYAKAHRDLHTLTDIQVHAYFPTIRSDLVRTAFRDAGFELVLKAVTVTDSHPELYNLIIEFLDTLETIESPRACFPVLWALYNKFSSLLGFGLSFDNCITCRKAFGDDDQSFLIVENGGTCCSQCVKTYKSRILIPPFVKEIFRHENFPRLPVKTTVPELLRITRLLASYCRYHFEIKNDFNTLDFIEEMTGMPKGLVPVNNSSVES